MCLNTYTKQALRSKTSLEVEPSYYCGSKCYIYWVKVWWC